MERLQKVLARAGAASRRQAEEMIAAGRVKVNGQVVTAMGVRVDPSKDLVEVDGKLLQAEEKVYFLLNKPAGYVTTVRDTHGRPTVIDLIKEVKQRIYPVGRLDHETEGALILTNDGELTKALTHPSHEVEKTYRAMVAGVPGEKELKRLREGVLLDDGLTAPARVLVKGKEKDKTILELVIHEGRKRQVRRMCKAIGHPVLYLKRVKIGFLDLRGLDVGDFRPLQEIEVNKLYRLAGIVRESNEFIK